MAIIGTFNREGENFVGSITTLALKAKATFRQIAKASDKAPDFRVYAAGVEIGAAWSMTSKAGKPYLSVKLDDPSFAGAIQCRLIQGTSEHALIWDR